MEGLKIALEERNPGAGETVAVRMLNRVIDHSSCVLHRIRCICYTLLSDGKKMLEVDDTTSEVEDLFEGFWKRFHSILKSEETGKAKGNQDPSSSSVNDDQLNMFVEWAKQNDKIYGSEVEYQKRFKIWCKTKKAIEHLYSLNPGDTSSIYYMDILADMLPSEKLKLLRGGLRNVGPLKPLAEQKREILKQLALKSEVPSSEQGNQDPLSSTERDQLLNMFRVWQERRGKKYESVEEENRRFKIWCNTKKVIDRSFAHYPKYTFGVGLMDHCADMTVSEIGDMESGGGGGPVQALSKLGKRKEGLEEVAKLRNEFDEWVERHKREYGSWEEREKRFMAYLLGRIRIDSQDPGSSKYGYDLENMDKFSWECPVIPLAPCE